MDRVLTPPETIGLRESDATRKFCYLLDVVYDLPEGSGVELVCVSRVREVFAARAATIEEEDDKVAVVVTEGEDDVVGRRSYKRAKSRFAELFEVV